MVLRSRAPAWAVAALATAAALSLPAAAEGASASLALTPAAIAAPADFSSAFRGYWWDFSDATRFAVEDSGEHFADPRLVDGWWAGTSTPHSVYPDRAIGTVLLTHLNIDYPEPTNWEPSEFRYAPLDPSYHYVSYRMCSSAPSKTLVYWFTDASKADADFGGTEYRTVVKGCWVYTFDLLADRDPDIGTLAWSAQAVYSLAVQPVTDPGVGVRLDYVTLTNRPRGETVSISWEGLAEPVMLHFVGPDGTIRTRIARNLTGGAYDWRTPNLAPGTYRVLAFDAAGTRVEQSLVVDGPATGSILDPSASSGPDYATEVIGDPWDMANPADVERALGVTGAAFAGGAYSAISTASSGSSGDPRLHLHVTTPIDPSRYHYLTYRMWVEGEGTLKGTGSVFRSFWFRDGSWDIEDRSYTQDLRVYQGWRTVTIDLADAYLQDDDIGSWGQVAALTDFRIDPHESPVPRAFHLDWVTLTGDVVADGTFRIRYQAFDPETGGAPSTVRFFYDADRRPTGGAARVPITCTPDGNPPPGLSCRWRTAPLPEGEYFIHMLLVDAAGNRTWVTGEVPLIVDHA